MWEEERSDSAFPLPSGMRSEEYLSYAQVKPSLHNFRHHVMISKNAFQQVARVYCRKLCIRLAGDRTEVFHFNARSLSVIKCNLYYLNIRKGDVWFPPGRDLVVFECYRCKVCCRRNKEKIMCLLLWE